MIKDRLENDFIDIWVTGEISNFKLQSSGHAYFSLKDEGAVIGAVIWRNVMSRIKYNLETGLKVVAHGRISLYEKAGRYQIVIDHIEPEGIGDLQQRFIMLKKMLEDRGYFDQEIKKQIPPFPERVGIVTSPTGAALRDMMNVMKRRFSNVDIIVFPAKVQGDGAAEEIASMIKIANALDNIDVLIIGRGGGSYEDLWAFNEEVVAHAVYNSKIPIISAVGHEIDFTISDFVADLRAPTPSAAAEIVVENKEDLRNTLNIYKARIQQKVFSTLNFYKERLNRYTEDELCKKINQLIERYKFSIDDSQKTLDNIIRGIYENRKSTFFLLAEKLEALSPLSILTRGYSIAYKLNGNEEIIKTSKQLQKDDKIKIRFKEGTSFCKVEENID